MQPAAIFVDRLQIAFKKGVGRQHGLSQFCYICLIYSSINMVPKKQGIDIINEVLEDCIVAYPISSFIISLYKQYRERGSLSKKQLQGLHGKASKIKDISPGKLATIEAIINKMPTRDKSVLPAATLTSEREEGVGDMIESILTVYPQHKRVLFFKSKYENNETLSAVEIGELERFKKLLK